jgi:hypothetical protein
VKYNREQKMAMETETKRKRLEMEVEVAQVMLLINRPGRLERLCGGAVPGSLPTGILYQ